MCKQAAQTAEQNAPTFNTELRVVQAVDECVCVQLDPWCCVEMIMRCRHVQGLLVMRLKLAHGVGVVHQVKLKGDKANLGGRSRGQEGVQRQGQGVSLAVVQMWFVVVCR